MANRNHYNHLLAFFTMPGLDPLDVIDALKDADRLIDAVEDREDETVAHQEARYAERAAQPVSDGGKPDEEQVHREKCRAELSSKRAGWETLSDSSRAMLVEELYMTERLLFGQLTLAETGQYAQQLLLRGASLAAIRSAKNRNIEEQCALLQSAALAYEAASKP